MWTQNDVQLFSLFYLLVIKDLSGTNRELLGFMEFSKSGIDAKSIATDGQLTKEAAQGRGVSNF